MTTTATIPIRTIRDWEERLSQFLQEVLQEPHREPEICERLIEYVLNLVRTERAVYRSRLLAKVLSSFNSEAV